MDKNYIRENGKTCDLSDTFSNLHLHESYTRILWRKRGDLTSRRFRRESSRNNKRNGPSVTIRNYEEYSEFYDGTFLFLAAVMHYDNDNNDSNKSATSPFCWLRRTRTSHMAARRVRKKMER